MSDEQKRPTIAENERSPASEAADEVPFAPPATGEEDDRPEPPGTAEAAQPKTDEEGQPVVPPARHHH